MAAKLFQSPSVGYCIMQIKNVADLIVETVIQAGVKRISAWSGIA
jgi:hypothetical protein